MICAGIVGLIKGSNVITDTAFDILSLEALFMVPRYDWSQKLSVSTNVAKGFVRH
jgi:hypothetical protein